ncbi:hypothetical protein [Sphingopyxis sp. PET50]|nr:hypothetical protein [Sphingopyxis sp. PET50]
MAAPACAAAPNARSMTARLASGSMPLVISMRAISGGGASVVMPRG